MKEKIKTILNNNLWIDCYISYDGIIEDIEGYDDAVSEITELFEQQQKELIEENIKLKDTIIDLKATIRKINGKIININY